ncbi:CD209 antigen-like protein E isoform X2 [Simochromis diagramma]|uniref:CD209 antigen-like protein E isoform X2 n=1 Tax=Simochromis diagramma TaxID=43689 RepID=UPI001A7EA99B|nr:CD209 antigen-like protein E isoform X2 [Simochromis diagramma]
MEEIYANVDCAKLSYPTHSTNYTGPRSSKRGFNLVIILSLGLLSFFLLIGLIILSVNYCNSLRDSAAAFSAISNNLSFVTEERDLLQANLTEKTKELERLQMMSKQKKTCPSRWSMFSCSCYLLSERSGSWDEGRKDCRNKGADLVVIESPEEQNPTWIGLNDKEEEGKWKWIDGTPLTLNNTKCVVYGPSRYWESNQPDNGAGDTRWGEEDCAHIRTPANTLWNDRSCGASLHWVCEKMS